MDHLPEGGRRFRMAGSACRIMGITMCGLRWSALISCPGEVIIFASYLHQSFSSDRRLAADTDVVNLTIPNTNGDMNVAWPSHLHPLAADDVRCGLGTECAVFDQISSERPTRSARCGIFGDTKSRREHPTEYCRLIPLSRLECEDEDGRLIYASGTTRALEYPPIKLRCVDVLAGREWDIHERHSGRNHLNWQFGGANVGLRDSERRRNTFDVVQLPAQPWDGLRHPSKIELIASPFQADRRRANTQAQCDRC